MPEPKENPTISYGSSSGERRTTPSPEKKQLYQFGPRLVLQTTPDNSEGADVLIHSPTEITIVDGVGSGATGNRRSALTIADLLHLSTEILPTSPSYLSLKWKGEKANIRARGGTLGVVWKKEKGLFKPEPVWIGQDEQGEQAKMFEFDMQGAHAGGFLTDGGVHLLAHPKLFGKFPDYSKVAPDIAERFQRGLISKSVQSGALAALLRPITGLINNHRKISTVQRLLNDAYQEFKASVTHEDQVLDDALVVVTNFVRK